jgi:putative NADH-flavin reductase
MRLTVFGATGGTGRHVVEQALAAGHDVTALVRDPGKVRVQNPRLRLVQGSILERGPVEEATAGADAVISALGPRSNEPVFEISRGMGHIVAAMQKCGVRRLVMTAGMGVADPQDRPGPMNRVINLLLALMARNVAQDMRQAVAAAQASNLDWTVVRAPRLVDKPGGGALKVGYVGQGVGFELARADFARALLEAATTATYVHQMPAVSN